MLDTLCSAYAATIAGALASGALPEFDVLFGPAYKGIPFAAGAALLLHRDHGRAVGFAYDRKEAKDHGEGGITVGTPVAGKRVVVVGAAGDDEAAHAFIDRPDVAFAFVYFLRCRC